MPTTTRGFLGRRRERDPRLPPGQYDAARLAGAQRRGHAAAPTERWTFTVEGLVEREVSWTWDEIHALPRSRYEGDIHCVTTWSKLGMTFDGVSVDTLLEAAEPLPDGAPRGRHLAHRLHHQPPARRRHRRQGVGRLGRRRKPLTTEHGGPARLLVPHLYFWKSAKWVSGLRLLDHDEPGFWERNGYHDRGDPWKEQRYQGD